MQLLVPLVLLSLSSKLFLCPLSISAQFVFVQGAGACKLVTELNTCSWIDYNAWFPGKDVKAADAAIGKLVDQIADEECKWAYTGTYTALLFLLQSNCIHLQLCLRILMDSS